MKSDRRVPHAPFLKKRRAAGHNPAAFRGKEARRLAIGGLGAWAVLSISWLLFPEQTTPVFERLSTVLSLGFMLSAFGLWFRMGNRAFVVGFAMVFLLYALTAWTPLAFDVSDFTIIAVLVSFLVFAVAGFNLAFIMEEIVHDAHHWIYRRREGLSIAPTLALIALVFGLQYLRQFGVPFLSGVWITSLISLGIMIGWWMFRALTPVRESRLLQELHLLIAVAICAAGLSDLAGLLSLGNGLLPSVVVFLVLTGTWVYVTYTTLQRTHFILGGRRVLPWLAILLSASFAILGHAQEQYRLLPTQELTRLVNYRVAYLVIGIRIGLVFLVLRGLRDLFLHLRSDARLDERTKRRAGQAAYLAGQFLDAEKVLEGAALDVYKRMDAILPGRHSPPTKPGWELGPEGLELFDHEEE